MPNEIVKSVKRITPQFSVDNRGKITWLSSLIDYDASLFYRGKTVTNDEFNTLFLQDVYQGNYLADSLTALFNTHLPIAIYRTFTSEFNLIPSFVKSFTTEDWGSIHEDGYYYITIPVSEHGFNPDDGSVLDKMNIDTEMYLLNAADGTFFEVSQVNTATDNTVTIYTDDNTLSGFVVIRTNDKAYALAQATIDATQVVGLAEVATSAKYTDLVDIDSANGPNTRIAKNASDILNIVNGTTIVPEAQHSVTSDEAVRLLTSSYIQGQRVSDIFEPGSIYVKRATQAKDYDTNTGTIKTKFDSVISNFESAISTVDTEINSLATDISNTYYKKTDIVASAVSADMAVKDDYGNVIRDTYTTGCVVERRTIDVQIRVADANTAVENAVDLFRDAHTSFPMHVVTIGGINSANKYILTGSFMRGIIASSARYDPKRLWLYVSNDCIPPKQIRLISDAYNNGVVPCYAMNEGFSVKDGEMWFTPYKLFDDGYDFTNGANIAVEFIY